MEHSTAVAATAGRGDVAGASRPRVDTNSTPLRSEYLTNALGHVSIYFYDENDNLIAIQDPLGRLTAYSYDAHQRLTSIILPNGAVSSNIYDDLGRVIETIAPDGTRIGTEYDAIDRPIRTIFLSESAAPGQPHVNGHPFTETRYGCCGVARAIDRNGNVTAYEHDPLGRLVRVTDPLGNTIRYQYNHLGELTALIDANGHATYFDYADFLLFGQSNRYLSAIRFPGDVPGTFKTRSFHYAPLTETVPASAWVTTLSTNGGDPTEHFYFENARTAGWYKASHPRAFIAEQSTRTKSWYQEPYAQQTRSGITYIWRTRNPVVAVQDGARTASRWEYHSNAYTIIWGISVVVTNENGVQQIYAYDTNGRLYETNPGTERHTSLQYNFLTDGNLNRVSNAAAITMFLYDELAQLLCESNEFINMPGRTHAVSYAYDPAGNRTSLQFQVSSFKGQAFYAYDSLDRLTNVFSSGIGNTASGINASYSFFHPSGRLKSKSYNNGVITDYAYDPLGRLTALTNRANSAILDVYRYDYNAANMITAITRNQQKMSFAYDTTCQLTAEHGHYISNFMPFVSFMVTNQFAYDPAGNRVQHSEIVNRKSKIVNYFHTPDNQLTAIVCNANTLTLRGHIENAWTVDWVRVKHEMALHWTPAVVRCQPGQPAHWEARDVPITGFGTIHLEVECRTPDNKTATYTVSYTRPANQSAQPSVLYAYDANGNRVQKIFDPGNLKLETCYSYDADNQLTGIVGRTETGTHYTRAYTYDAFGRRISATEDGVTRYFAFDGLDVIAELSQVSSFEFQVSKHYARGAGLGGGIGDVIAIWDPASGIRYPSYNHRGDVVTVTDASGAVVERNEYTAFGEPVSGIWNPASGILPAAFSSKEFDTASGLSYYGFRYYGPHSARWMNKDLLKHAFNSAYCLSRNQPVLLIDYYGMAPYDPRHSRARDAQAFSQFARMNIRLREQCNGTCCCGTSSKCNVDVCKSEVGFVASALINTWRANYGNGSNTSCDQVGGYLCWDWSRAFEQAVNRSHFACWSAHEQALQHTKSDIVHFYVELRACNNSATECVSMVDDGFMKNGYVHYPPWPDLPTWVPDTWTPEATQYTKPPIVAHPITSRK